MHRASPEQSVFVLALVNALAALTIFYGNNEPGRPRHRMVTDLILLVGWSFSYCFTYALFLIFPAQIDLPQLIICESMAPLLAAWASKDLGRHYKKPAQILLRATPLLLLILLAAYSQKHSAGHESKDKNYIILFWVLVGFIVSQVCARRLSRHRPAGWIQPRFTFLNAAILTVALLTTGNIERVRFDVGSALSSGFAALLIVLLQLTYINGLKKTEPVIASLMLSTSVPISLFFSRVWYRSPLSFVELFLAVSYCISVYFVHWRVRAYGSLGAEK
jgi:drug/metabolite transporter (DMT)-like permease